MQMPEDISKKKDQALSQNLVRLFNENSHITIHDETILGGFAPMADEPNWMVGPYFKKVRLAFPAMEQHHRVMVFHESRYDELEERSDFGVIIRVPKKDFLVVIPDILIIPGLGFDWRGARLGRGKGFYDRFLETFSGIKIGVGYEEIIHDSIPIEDHDICMDFVVSDQRIVEIEKTNP